MTKRLILVRHAKSDWGDPGKPDRARPLNDRGRRSARALGTWLRSKRHLPAAILCSDATRTRETWDLIEERLKTGRFPRLEPAMYLATPETLLQVLHDHGRGDCVMMLAHNPGIADFAALLARIDPAHPRFRDYPTGATTVLDFESAEWRGVDPGKGNVVDFTVPRDLGVE